MGSEPVAWLYERGSRRELSFSQRTDYDLNLAEQAETPLYTRPPAPEPIPEVADVEAVAIVLRNSIITFGGVKQTKLGEKAAALLSAQAVMLEEAREALEPFAKCAADWIPDDEDEEEWAKFRLLVKDFHRARSAHAKLEAGNVG